MNRAQRAWWLTVAGAATLAVLVVAVPALRIGVESERTRVALETSHALVAALCGLLLFGRHRRTARDADLVVAAALFLAASTNILLEVVGADDANVDRLTFTTWVRLGQRVLTGGALAWAALHPTLRLPRLRRPALTLWVAVSWSLGGITGLSWLLVDVLPPGTEVLLVDGRLDPTITDEPLVAAVEVAIVTLYALASFGFARQLHESVDPLTRSLAIGTVLATASWAIFIFYASVFTSVVQPGDLLRLGFYVVLAVGAGREINAYWTRTVQAAASDERRRMARELHDGLAQELAFLTRATRLLARGEAPEGTEEMLVSASDRALDEARRAVSALNARGDEPLVDAITAAATDVGARTGSHVSVEVHPGVVVTGNDREAVLRIVREAVGNAGRHGSARHVWVTLDADGLLTIRDDGVGFDPGAVVAKPGRFGLTSMRERAEGLGGSLSLRAAPGSGTIVEVRLPSHA